MSDYGFGFKDGVARDSNWGIRRKLIWSNEFKGDSLMVTKTAEDFSNEGGSLFSETMPYYVVPK